MYIRDVKMNCFSLHQERPYMFHRWDVASQATSRCGQSNILMECGSSRILRHQTSSEVLLHILIVDSLEEVQVTQFLGWVDRCPDLCVVEDDPPPVLENMSNIMPTVGRGAHVTHYSHEPVLCSK